jgi:hypothetical protein
MNIENPAAGVFRERAERFGRESDRQAQRLSRITHGRLATFLAVVLLLVAGEASGSSRGYLFLAAIVSFIGFIALVWMHRRTAGRVRYYEEIRKLNLEAAARLRRDWANLPAPIVEPPSKDHPYAGDLDVFGPASLYRLICSAATPQGQGCLAEWLLQPAEPDVIKQRQKAVADLAEQIDLRDELAARARLLGSMNRQVVDRFVTWSGGDAWILTRPWLIVAAWLLPVSTVVLLVLQVIAVLSLPFWAITFVGGLLLTWHNAERIENVFKSASSGEAALRRFSGLFEAVSSCSFQAPLLVRLQSLFSIGGVPAHKEMGRLERILACADVRLSDMLHFFVQAITLWDFHVLAALERWQESNRQYVSSWFSAFGELEALSALAGLAQAHPQWVYPEFRDDNTHELQAAALGHPLLNPETCVTNDVRLGPPGRFLLVTGSNMSGKSTLLRAIGVNVVLAQAGGPVCASRFLLPSARVFTAMHVQDSLEQGVSQFMSALNRLKLIADAARRTEPEGVTFIYLLDEILQGTNVAERKVAVRKIVRHLLEKKAIGAISTHDLTLADTDDLEIAADPVHFRETVGESAAGPTLTFDYKLRPGIATSTNALRLMEIVGL